MLGRNLSHYEILEAIGRGGIGEVYRAKDLKLDRDVAIKVLKEELASDPERLRRFEQEARAASALDHPNIITIHDIAESDGLHYIVMQYVEGKTLRELLIGGPLTPAELLRYATQIAEGLARAHSTGIIHRDLKPQNVMVTNDGYVKILDFGLAKLLQPPSGAESEAATLTKEGTVPGMVMGTAGYMSPEQALGQTLDARTDVFSLGALLYEMATGKRAFEGDTLAALFNEILNKTPTPAHQLNPEVPAKLAQIIRRALEKDPALRYPSAVELRLELEGVKPFAEPPEDEPERSIVVLPFEDLSPDRDNEYFSDGLTEEIIADLSKVGSLRVISRTSAMRLKGTDKDLRTIATDLNVQFVLEGTVRKAGNKLRITAQLIDAERDAHLWAEKYSGSIDDVFEIQESVSKSVVDSLKLKLTPKEQQQLSEKPIADVQAYQCYMQARQEYWKLTEESLQRALRHIRNGLDIVGDNAHLYAGLGNIYYHYYDLTKDRKYASKIEGCAKKISELDPDSAHGHHLMGLYLIHDSALKAYPQLKRSYEIAPNEPETLFWLAWILAFNLGEKTNSSFLAEKILSIDRLSWSNYMVPMFVYWFQGRADLGLQYGMKFNQMVPDNMFAKWSPATLLAWNGKYGEAFDLIDRLATDAPGHYISEVALLFKYCLQKDEAAVKSNFTKELRDFAWEDYYVSWYLANCFALINDKTESLNWLEHAVDKGLINYPLLSRDDPFLENVRGDERFRKLMERVEHEWEHFEI